MSGDEIGKKRKRGPQSFKENKKLYRGAGWEAKLREQLDKGKSNPVGKTYRYGYTLMWRVAADEMRRYNMGKLGSFDRSNGHNGIIYGWKKECNMSDNKAKKILLACFRSGQLTLPMLKAVRKHLAYAWQLMGRNGEQSNWPSVPRVWKVISQAQLPSFPERSPMPKVVPTPEQLKKAFTSKWKPGSSMSFATTIVARTGALHTLLQGARPNEDMSRIKASRTHRVSYPGGWMCTKYKGGRAKLAGEKKGGREWWAWARCWCPGGEHKRVPPAARYCLDTDGNPRNGKAPFEERCPLAQFEFMNLWCRHKKDWRLFPNILKSTGAYGKSNTGPIVELAIDWVLAQGVGDPDFRFGTNSGRKALGLTLTKLGLAYEYGMEMHGDLYETWEGSYQPGCFMLNGNFRRRKQSTEVNVATRALSTIGTYFGMGAAPHVPGMVRMERQLDAVLRRLGDADLADRILLGLPDRDS